MPKFGVADVSHDKVVASLAAFAESMDQEHDDLTPKDDAAFQRKVAWGMIASKIHELADAVRDGKATVFMVTNES
jgi:hypothetical protein